MASFKCMIRDSDEWHNAWSVVHNTSFSVRKPGPVRSDEFWQYMGTFQEESGKWTHQFRHRYHPATGQCERLNIPVRNIDQLADPRLS